MSYKAGPSSREGPVSAMAVDVNFEIFEWYPAYQSCLKFFLNNAQHEYHVQAVAAFVNICLPFQWAPDPVVNYSAASPTAQTASGTSQPPHANPWTQQSAPFQPGRSSHFVSLIPYIKRLVVTAFDQDAILHGFFGDDWRKGIGPLHESERRNYMFAAKSVGWARVKQHYDMSPRESLPFIKPLQNVELTEIEAAERSWSGWLAFEDWMIGERAPETMRDPGFSEGGGPNMKPNTMI
ncbi:hypothetical protein P152DRAFT_465329 [Eremomyces bilateralis CBS 781.70]|uniref:Ilp is an apoptosis inhibitor n=1 Tax=Eremomyces bilateralis CBS 781.70 TaxID=1392243 RepID=A0A6G1G9A5_9PEZI|nr:uncharacterized protein P152DRAFT_465329 [Eremomyces bilateralis CBS 781.70]KAF1814490.1 hypothetical protein P152DRAFT_465329 [Eremomyces bilateralis CBS 781.70]